MSNEYEKALRVISKPPEKRYDHEIRQLVPWLRTKAKLFKGLKAEILADIIRNCQYDTKNRDDVIIKQGDVGDCFYITLNGKVTLYILNKDQLEGEVDDGDFSNVIQYTKDGDLDRSKLGNFVTSLEGGAPFGDVALTSGDSIRTASIIADERTDLLVVDRALYNRSMKEVLAKEFLEKTTFIRTNPLFANWPPKYRKQLAMALYKETFGYESTLTRQGDRTADMYFILRGQVEIQLDPYMHPQQYPLIFKADRENEVEKLIRKVEKPRQTKERNNSQNQQPLFQATGTNCIKRRDSSRCTRLCHLGVNESVGDVELTMELPSYMQTSVCRETTEVLVLEKKHYERLFMRRHPKTIEELRDQIGVKLASRLSMLKAKSQVPFLGLLRKIIESRHKAPAPHDRDDEHSVSRAEKDFLNHKGPLIDLHGPGSVFFLIKLRERTKRRVRAKRGERNDRQYPITAQNIPSSLLLPASNPMMNGSPADMNAIYGRPRSARGLQDQARSFRLMQAAMQEREATRLTDLVEPDGAQRLVEEARAEEEVEEERRDAVVVVEDVHDATRVDQVSGQASPSVNGPPSPHSPSSVRSRDRDHPRTHDARLTTLESRLRVWLEKGSPRGKPQVAPLRRLAVQDMEFQPRPGNKVVVRKKSRQVSSAMTSSSPSASLDSPREGSRPTALEREKSKMAAYEILLTH